MSKLEDFCINITDGEHGTVKDVQASEFFLLSNKNIKNSKIYIDSSDRTISQADYEKINKRTKLEHEDVVIATVGTIGKTAVLDNPSNYVFQRSVGIIKTNKKILNPYYLKYQIDAPYFQKRLQLLSKGGVQKCIFINDLKKLEVNIPPIKEQEEIVLILKNIDSKIENNNAIISELESMAKDIYDYWFVQFDFPNENGNPYKSSGGKMVWNEELKREIPEGWKVSGINKMFESKRGISYNTETITGEGIPMINLASFNVNSTYKKEGLKSYSGKYSDEDIIRPYDLLMCNTQQTDLDPQKDIIGKTILVPDIFGGSDIVASHHVTRLLCTKPEYKSYIDSSSKTSWFHKAMAANCSGTSIMGLNSDLAFKFQIILPDANCLSKFHDLYMQIKKKESVILNENSELTALRDFLLPALMNGQVKIRKDAGNDKYQS